jgi:hypothetical protein
MQKRNRPIPKRNREVKSLGDALKDVFQKERERGARLLEGQRQADAQRKKINEVMDAPKKAPAPRVQFIDTSRPASEAEKKAEKDTRKTPRTEIDYDMGPKTVRVRSLDKLPKAVAKRLHSQGGRGRTYTSFKKTAPKKTATKKTATKKTATKKNPFQTNRQGHPRPSPEATRRRTRS